MSDFLWQKYPDQWDRCPACDGTGKVNCANCGGKGKSFGPHRELFGEPRAGRIHRSLSWKQCQACDGEGKRPCSCINGSRSKAGEAIGPTAEIPQTTLFEKQARELLEDNKKAVDAFSGVLAGNRSAAERLRNPYNRWKPPASSVCSGSKMN
jgi:hypothetical protein